MLPPTSPASSAHCASRLRRGPEEPSCRLQPLWLLPRGEALSPFLPRLTQVGGWPAPLHSHTPVNPRPLIWPQTHTCPGSSYPFPTGPDPGPGQGGAAGITVTGDPGRHQQPGGHPGFPKRRLPGGTGVPGAGSGVKAAEVWRAKCPLLCPGRHICHISVPPQPPSAWCHLGPHRARALRQ